MAAASWVLLEINSLPHTAVRVEVAISNRDEFAWSSARRRMGNREAKEGGAVTSSAWWPRLAILDIGYRLGFWSSTSMSWSRELGVAFVRSMRGVEGPDLVLKGGNAAIFLYEVITKNFVFQLNFIYNNTSMNNK